MANQVTRERYGGFSSHDERRAVIDELRAKGIAAADDYSGACQGDGDEHWHAHFITVRGLTPEQANRVLGRPTFERVIGGWIFTANGLDFMAIRNEAGFEGRNWELWTFDRDRQAHGGQIEDMLPSRAACLARAKEISA